MRRHLPVFITAVVLLGFLAVAIKFMVDAWQHSTAVMSIHGWVALGLGVFFSIVIGCGLMALMFYSSRYGYDEQAQSTEYHRGAPCGPNDPLKGIRKTYAAPLPIMQEIIEHVPPAGCSAPHRIGARRRRDAALIALLFAGALRRSEITGLDYARRVLRRAHSN